MENRAMNLLLGVIALVADLLGIVTFIVTGQVSHFWSATWLVMLVGLGLLLAIALFFLDAAKHQSTHEFLPFASGAYALLSCIAVLFGLYALGSKDVTFGTFVGITVLIGFPAVMAFFVSKVSGNKAHRPVSYLYAATGILAIIGLMFRYMNKPEFSWSIAGEILVLAGIGISFTVFSDA